MVTVLIIPMKVSVVAYLHRARKTTRRFTVMNSFKLHSSSLSQETQVWPFYRRNYRTKH